MTSLNKISMVYLGTNIGNMSREQTYAVVILSMANPEIKIMTHMHLDKDDIILCTPNGRIKLSGEMVDKVLNITGIGDTLNPYFVIKDNGDLSIPAIDCSADTTNEKAIKYAAYSLLDTIVNKDMVDCDILRYMMYRQKSFRECDKDTISVPFITVRKSALEEYKEVLCTAVLLKALSPCASISCWATSMPEEYNIMVYSKSNVTGADQNMSNVHMWGDVNQARIVLGLDRHISTLINEQLGTNETYSPSYINGFIDYITPIIEACFKNNASLTRIAEVLVCDLITSYSEIINIKG